MSGRFENKIALVTGASRGIGRAAAIALGREGAHVICVARTVGGLEETDDAIQKAGGTATLVPLGMTDSDGIARLAASAAWYAGPTVLEALDRFTPARPLTDLPLAIRSGGHSTTGGGGVTGGGVTGGGVTGGGVTGGGVTGGGVTGGGVEVVPPPPHPASEQASAPAITALKSP